jgi:hypothetical protein
MSRRKQSPAPLSERWQSLLKNSRIGAIAIVATAIVAGLASWTEGITKIKGMFINDTPKPSPVVPLNPTIQVNPTVKVDVNPTINVNPFGSPAFSDKKLQDIMIAEDRAAIILAEFEADKNKVLDAIVDRNEKRNDRKVQFDRDLLRVQAQHTVDFDEFSRRYDTAVKRFKSLHKSYIDALNNDQSARAEAIKNEIHGEQLQFQLEVLIATADYGRNLTNDLVSQIRDRFSRVAYHNDPIPEDVVVQRILKENSRTSAITTADAEKLPRIEIASVGSLARVSGQCAFLRAGETSNDRSVAVLNLKSDAQGTSRAIAWFEWGWGTHLVEMCNPSSDLTLVGFYVGENDGAKVLRATAIPGRKQKLFRYRAPHYPEADKLLVMKQSAGDDRDFPIIGRSK